MRRIATRVTRTVEDILGDCGGGGGGTKPGGPGPGLPPPLKTAFTRYEVTGDSNSLPAVYEYPQQLNRSFQQSIGSPTFINHSMGGSGISDNINFTWKMVIPDTGHFLFTNGIGSANIKLSIPSWPYWSDLFEGNAATPRDPNAVKVCKGGFGGLLLWPCIPDKHKVKAQDTTKVTYISGTWTNSNLYRRAGTASVPPPVSKYTTDNGAKLAFQVKGSTIYVVYTNWSRTNPSTLFPDYNNASFTMKVDNRDSSEYIGGQSVYNSATYENCINALPGESEYRHNYMPNLIRLTGLQGDIETVHDVEITVSSPGGLTDIVHFDYAAGNGEHEASRSSVYRIAMVRRVDNRYNANITVSHYPYFNGATQEIVDALQDDGFFIHQIGPNPAFDWENCLQDDGVHLTRKGHYDQYMYIRNRMAQIEELTIPNAPFILSLPGTGWWNGKVDTEYNGTGVFTRQIVGVTGVWPYTFTSQTGLPPDMTMSTGVVGNNGDGGGGGIFSGFPRAASSYTVQAQAHDSATPTPVNASISGVLTVNP